MQLIRRSFLFSTAAFLAFAVLAQQPASPPAVAEHTTYLAGVTQLARVKWPKNRTINIVCHGHSVPAGYFKTPEVHSLEAYPHLLRAALAQRFPLAVINVVVTAIGGEASDRGAARFERDVLALHPDVITIDYALNDRRLGLPAARRAWVDMITKAQAQGIKILLLTPTPDQSAKLDDANDPLVQHAAQIRQLAAEYHLGLVDSLAAFQEAIKAGAPLLTLMAQVNHPNAQGHELVAKALMSWFP